MKKILFFILLFLVQNLFGQSKLPLIRANSKTVTIVDGDMISTTTWTLTPSAKPDVYTADRTIKTTVLRDPRGNKFETKVVNCPKVMLDNQALMNVPVSLLGSKNPVGFEMNYLGNDLLKRFNTILDLRTDCIYFKPNSLLNVPYKEAS